jgi:hypothetical protein
VSRQGVSETPLRVPPSWNERVPRIVEYCQVMKLLPGGVAEGFGEIALELVPVIVCQTKSRSETPSDQMLRNAGHEYGAGGCLLCDGHCP